MTTLLLGEHTVTVDADTTGDDLWLAAAEVAGRLGWELKPEGLCRDDVCIPGRQGLTEGDRVNVAELWRLLGRPVLRDEAGTVWALGDDPGARRAALEALEAPDFTLPDLAGRMHSLSEYRGKKVLLASWASW